MSEPFDDVSGPHLSAFKMALAAERALADDLAAVLNDRTIAIDNTDLVDVERVLARYREARNG